MSKEKPVSKRQQIRDQRRKKEQRQRIYIVIGAVAVVLIVIIILVGPSIRNATTPVGQFTVITPQAYPDTNGTSMGNANAAVVVDVYEDFQCPACKNFTETIEPQIIAAFVVPGKVRYVFHNYPFLDDSNGVKESDQAANAVMCANDQGRFWDYHDILYKNSEEFNGAFVDKRLVAYADSLKLDMDAFNACYSARRFQSQITQDQAAGNAAGVSGTPTVFVNGQHAGQPGYIPSFDEISQLINSELANAGN